MGETQLAVGPRSTQLSSADVILHMSRDQLANVLSGLADGILALSPTGEFVFANAAAARIIGYASVEALFAAPLTDTISKFEMYDEAGQALSPEDSPSQRALRGFSDPPRTVRFRTFPAGEERWSVVTAQSVYDEAGQLQLVVTVFHEITDIKRAELGQRLLAEASVLLTASLDYEVRLRNITQLMVPDFADWCAIDLGTADGPLERVALANTDPTKLELAYETRRRYPPDPKSQSGVYEVLRTGKPIVFDDIPDQMLETTISDPEQLKIARQLGIKAAMVVPLNARGRTLGAITLVWSQAPRRFIRNDLALIEDLAHRTALAVDNAQLYAQAQQFTTELEARVKVRTTQLESANIQLVNEIAERRQIEEEVQSLNTELEERVIERTLQLERVNNDLKNEIAAREKAGQAQRALLRRTRELYFISRTIGSVRTADEVLHALLSSSDLKRVSRASIAIFDQPIDEHTVPEYCSLEAAWNVESSMPLFVGQRFTIEGIGLTPPYLRDEPVVIDDINSYDALSTRVRQRFKLLKTRSLILFPLIATGEWYGILSLHFKVQYAVAMEDLRHLRGLVDQAAIAIHTLRSLEAEARARRAAEAADALKLQFLAMISHELRTPLTSIKGFATTLLAEDVQWSAANQHDFLETISEEADKLGDLIEQLLDLSRLSAGQLRIVRRPQTVQRIVDTAIAQLRMVAAQHQLVLQIPTDLPTLQADNARLAQVVTNLVGNAVKFAPLHSTITLSAQLVGEAIQFDVSDEGPGIPPDERARLFQPFQQSALRNTNHAQGAGLGLAICKGLVEAHGGRIWIQDRSGPGTTVSFTIPLDSYLV